MGTSVAVPIFSTDANSLTTNFNGAVGINLTNATPAGSLEVNGKIKIDSNGLVTGLIYPPSDSTTAIQINKANGTTNILNIDTTNARIGINTAAPVYSLDVTGTGHFSTSVTATAYYHNSDARLKMDVHPVDNALNRLLAIKGVEFNWKKDGRADMGVVAQNVAEVFPNVVSKDSNGMMSVEYDSLVGPMIEGMRQLKTENDGLKAEIKEIRAEINVLQQNNAATHTTSTIVKMPSSTSVAEH